jgi:hypothetical protein
LIKRIKKYKNNEYALTEHSIWVRNPISRLQPSDINHLTSDKDYRIFVDNELHVLSLNLMPLGEHKVKYDNCIIVSDGYNFNDCQEKIKNINEPCLIIGINGSLKKWKPEVCAMQFYLVNNPYQECCSFLPSNKYFPNCIVASRTNTEFIKRYKGVMYLYSPTYESKFDAFHKSKGFRLDDYRNPLCAALSTALFFNANKIALLCCDNSLKDHRPGTEQLSNGLYSYPQHKIVHNITDAMAFFIKRDKPETQIANFSDGWEYENIKSHSDLAKFFAP